jgi:hypothetical protein
MEALSVNSLFQSTNYTKVGTIILFFNTLCNSNLSKQYVYIQIVGVQNLCLSTHRVFVPLLLCFQNFVCDLLAYSVFPYIIFLF